MLKTKSLYMRGLRVVGTNKHEGLSKLVPTEPAKNIQKQKKNKGIPHCIFSGNRCLVVQEIGRL